VRILYPKLDPQLSSLIRQALFNYDTLIVIVVIVIVIVTAVTTISPPLFCDIFDCCVCSVVESSPLPHPVVAISPTTSAIVIVTVVVAVAIVVIIIVVVVAY